MNIESSWNHLFSSLSRFHCSILARRSSLPSLAGGLPCCLLRPPLPSLSLLRLPPRESLSRLKSAVSTLSLIASPESRHLRRRKGETRSSRVVTPTRGYYSVLFRFFFLDPCFELNCWFLLVFLKCFVCSYGFLGNRTSPIVFAFWTLVLRFLFGFVNWWVCVWWFGRELLNDGVVYVKFNNVMIAWIWLWVSGFSYLYWF